jgi:hypothetical protein
MPQAKPRNWKRNKSIYLYMFVVIKIDNKSLPKKIDNKFYFYKFVSLFQIEEEKSLSPKRNFKVSGVIC